MRIQKLETYSNEFVCFVKLTADTGAIDWGHKSTYNADITAAIFHRQIAPWALGADALDIGALIELVEDRYEHQADLIALDASQAPFGLADFMIHDAETARLQPTAIE